jgi:uncharacterized repeat protein (TIGR01451 family)
MALAILIVLATPGTASPAQTFTVNSTVDAVDSNVGDGLCSADIGGEATGCTLRAAIMEAGEDGGANTIIVPAGLYKLTLVGNNEDQSVSGDLDVTGGSGMDLTITGAGPGLTVIDGQSTESSSSDRVFDIPSSGPTVSISGVTMQNGQTSGDGGIVRNNGTLTLTNTDIAGGGADGSGGGIYNNGALTATGTNVLTSFANNRGGGIFNAGAQGTGAVLSFTGGTVFDNEAGGNGGGIYNEPLATATVLQSTLAGNINDEGSGGAIANQGTFTLDRSTVTNNGFFQDGEFSATSFKGGGVYNAFGPVFTVGESSSRATFSAVNSTISGNTAIEGGGVYNEAIQLLDAPLAAAIPVPTVSLQSVTLTLNKAKDGVGAGIYDQAVVSPPSAPGPEGSAVAILKNTILSANTAGTAVRNCGGVDPVSQGHNLENADTCALNTTPGDGDLVSVDPKLGPLADNGGPTFTHALLTGSPAIDAAATSPATDQRGITRPQGPASDIGAFEVVVVVVPPPAPSADLSIVKTASAQTVLVGADITYTLTVHNNGPNTSSGVSVSDALPAGVSFVSSTASQGSCSGTSTVTCALGSLANGATATIAITVRTTAAGTVPNTGVVSATTADPSSANNSSTVSSQVNAPKKPVARCRVPNVKAKTLAGAKKAIAKAGCRLGKVGSQISTTQLKGRVVSQSPHGGTSVPLGTRVSVVLGSRPRPVKKPHFTG